MSKFTKLADTNIRNFYLNLSREEQELFDERAGYLEYDECLTRGQAEYKTFIEMMKLRRANLLKV